jgi:hypothetical protein
MANPEHVAKLKAGTAVWNTWVKSLHRRPDLVEADFKGAVLRNANLEGADLHRTSLEKADLKDTRLVLADLSDAHLEGADLRGANLFGANLDCANLSAADLRDTDLSRVNLNRAVLRDANLETAVVGETLFTAMSLSEVKGLEHCRHARPSSLDYHTLVQSGFLPLPFLRGCGLSDAFIEYLPSLLQQAVQFYSCFISYSTKDQDFADRLYADLQNKGVRCWFAPHKMQGGKKLHEQIDDAIRIYDRLLLILSEHSMTSTWVETEISKARKREIHESRRVLFPVRLVDFERLRDWECFDADSGKDSAREIREYFIPDFSQWKDHDAYRHAFERLLTDLKAHQAT